MGVVRNPDINKTHIKDSYFHSVRKYFIVVASLDWRPKPELELNTKEKKKPYK